VVILEGIFIFDVSKMHFSSELNFKVQTIFENKFPQLKETESHMHCFSTPIYTVSIYF